MAINLRELNGLNAGREANTVDGQSFQLIGTTEAVTGYLSGRLDVFEAAVE